MNSAPLVTLATGFLQGFLGAKTAQMEQEKALLMSSIDNAVKSGSPEALGLLNPEKLALYGLDQFIPTYTNLATTVQKERLAQQRRLEAQTQLAESQARVGAATEESQIKTSKLQTQRAEQQVEGGAIELEQAQAQQQILRDNPKLLMLPFEKQQMEIQNIQSEMTAREQRTKLQWAELGAQNAVRKAQIGEISGRRVLQNMQAQYLQGLPEEERNQVLQQMLTPGVESMVERSANQFRQRADSAQKNWQSVYQKLFEGAQKEGKDSPEFASQEAAEEAALRLNTAALQFNTLNESFTKQFGIPMGPEIPQIEAVAIPGTLYGTKGYRLAPKQAKTKQLSLKEEISQLLGMEGEQTPPDVPEKKQATKEEKPATQQSGRFKKQSEGLGKGLVETINPEGRKPRGVQ